jgi:hypothetical protein
MWNSYLPEHQAQYRQERMAEAEQWRLVRLVAAPPIYAPLLTWVGRSLIRAGQRLATLERANVQHVPHANLNIRNTAV